MRKSIFRKTSRTGLIGFLFGLPFASVGSFFVWAGLTAEEINGGPPSILLRVGWVAFSMIFVLIGLVMMFGVSGIEVDPERRLLSKWWGLLIPFRRTSEPLGDVALVRIKKEVRMHHSSKGGTTTTIVFPVQCIVDGEEIPICESKAYLTSRSEGESLAACLEVPLEDTSTGERVVRDPDELDLSLREMLLRYGARPERPQLGEGLHVACRTRQESGGEAAQIVIPSPAESDPHPGLVRAAFTALGVAVVVLVAMHWRTFRSPSMDAVLSRLFPTLLLVAFIGFVLSLLRNGFTSYTVYVSPSELRLTSRCFGIGRTRTIPVQQLEELRVEATSGRINGGNGSLRALGDGIEVRFAEFSPMADIDFVDKMIRHIIAG